MSFFFLCCCCFRFLTPFWHWKAKTKQRTWQAEGGGKKKKGNETITIVILRSFFLSNSCRRKKVFCFFFVLLLPSSLFWARNSQIELVALSADNSQAIKIGSATIVGPKSSEISLTHFGPAWEALCERHSEKAPPHCKIYMTLVVCLFLFLVFLHFLDSLFFFFFWRCCVTYRLERKNHHKYLFLVFTYCFFFLPHRFRCGLGHQPTIG